MTFEEFIPRFIHHIETHRKPTTIRLYRLIIRRYLKPEFGHRQLTDIKRYQVIELHTLMKKKRTMANRMLAVGSSMYSYAQDLELIEPNINPFKGVAKYKEALRERYLSSSEYGRVFQALREMEKEGNVSKYGLNGIKVCMLTGCRASEIETLNWQDVKIEQRGIELKDSKTSPRTVELAPAVVNIFQSIPKRPECDLVFPGIFDGRIGLSHLWAKVRKRANLEDVRLHDLRHSYATLATVQGIPNAGDCQAVRTYERMDNSKISSCLQAICF